MKSITNTIYQSHSYCILVKILLSQLHNLHHDITVSTYQKDKYLSQWTGGLFGNYSSVEPSQSQPKF